jgi:DNA-binding LacI/PurR family transcriptional regulator
MKLPPLIPSLRTVAAAAKVSPMTVSRVMNNSPHVSAETRRKVEAATRKLGYLPDPHIARLMAQVRQHRRRSREAVIAVIRDDIPEDDFHDRAYHYVSIEDFRSRAARHGYRVDEFIIGPRGATPRRVVSILQSRGIEGIIVSPESTRFLGSLLDYENFAAATIGYGLQKPSLHRASTNMTSGIHLVTSELTRRGYTRIGLAITDWLDVRSDHTCSAAMLNFQRSLPEHGRVPLLLFPENNISHQAATFCAWFEKHHPDVIISFETYVPDWLTTLLGLRIPADIGFVVFDWEDHLADFAGIHHQRRHVAAAAVDLVAAQLMQNERGIPDVPRHILIPPFFVDGPSVRQKG